MIIIIIKSRAELKRQRETGEGETERDGKNLEDRSSELTQAPP